MAQGYFLKKLNELQVDPDLKRQLMDHLYRVFDDMTTDEARDYWRTH